MDKGGFVIIRDQQAFNDRAHPISPSAGYVTREIYEAKTVKPA
jgi:hypothetical protein